jgi:hypothetical protein
MRRPKKITQTLKNGDLEKKAAFQRGYTFNTAAAAAAATPVSSQHFMQVM